MAESPVTQTGFGAGIFSPSVFGRTDLSLYSSSAKEILNAIVRVQGPAERRSGTKFVREALGSTIRLVPFSFSATDTYVIEFGESRARFYRDGGIILDETTVVGISGQVITIDGDHTGSLAAGDVLTIEGGPNEGEYTITLVAANASDTDVTVSESIPDDSSTAGAVKFPYAIASPYTAAQARQFDFTQKADVMLFAHGDVSPRQLTRTSDTSWAFAEFEYRDGPYDEQNSTPTTLLPSATTGSITITASDDVFVSTDVGRLVRISYQNGKAGYAEITSYTSATEVDADVIDEFNNNTSARDTWRLGAWSDTLGWPSTVAFHSGRLWWGRGQTVWGSRTDDFESYAPNSLEDSSVADDDAVTATFNSHEVAEIVWMESLSRGLAVGTVGGEFVVRSQGLSEPITPTNVGAPLEGTFGSERYVKPVRAATTVIFPQRTGRKVREMVFQFDRDQYVAADRSILAEHLFASTVDEMAYTRSPDPIIWCVLGDGTVVAMSYEPDQEVRAWHRHDFGGTVLSIASVRGSERDELWMAVQRTVDGSTVNYIEHLQEQFRDEDDQEDAFFVDSGLTYDGWNTDPTKKILVNGTSYGEGDEVQLTAATHAPWTFADVGRTFAIRDEATSRPNATRSYQITITAFLTPQSVIGRLTSVLSAQFHGAETSEWARCATVLSGLDHLEGETVSVLSDGAPVPDAVVTNGAITLETPGAVVHAGLGYTTLVTTSRLLPTGAGDPRGRRGVPKYAVLDFYRTLGAECQQEDGFAWDRLEEREGQTFYGVAPPLRTGTEKLGLDGVSERETFVSVRQTAPLPLTIRAITVVSDVSGF